MESRRRLKGLSSGADLVMVRQVRQLVAVFALVFSMVLSSFAPAMADDSDLVVEGGGWGHGIGMSQYGAYGQALDGKTAEEIVGYYYDGSSTALIAGQVDATNFLVTDPAPLWVNLLAAKTVFQFKALNGPLKVCQGATGGCDFKARPGEVWRFVALGDGTCQLEADGEAVSEPAACDATVKGMAPDGARIEIAGLETSRDEFARGKIRVRTPNSGASMHVVLEINLEEYMYGLAEVPFSWHPEALRAQALAGRSYAAWKLLSNGPEAGFTAGQKTKCWCQMFATTVDQSYSGWANEAASGAAKWQAAVDSTAGRVITHPQASQNNIVAAFYSSSTGGRTENNEDMWGGSPVGYLRSKPDPWSQAPAVGNPFGRWSFSFSEADLAAKFGVDKVDGMAIKTRYASGTPSTIEVYTRTDGVKATITTSGPSLYSTLALRGRNIDRFAYGDVPTLGGDFDGDGRGDVAMVTAFNDTWWVGTSSPGVFTMSGWLNLGGDGAFRDQVTGDFNGDGKTDVATMEVSTGRLIVGLSTGSRFRSEVWANHVDPQRWSSLRVGDFDGDGADDIAEYESHGERWRIYRLVDGKPVREFWYDFSVTNPNWGAHVVGDYNGDGFDDILSLDAATGDLIVLSSDGAGMTPHLWRSLPHDGPWRDLIAADYSGDGIDDLAAYDPATSSWWAVTGRAGATAAAPAKWYTFPVAGQDLVSAVAGDFTGDGRADIVAYNRTNGKLKMLTSDGSSFSKNLWGAIPAKRRIANLIALDSDGDGRLDVAAWDNTRRRWWVAANQAHSTFEVSSWGKLLK